MLKEPQLDAHAPWEQRFRAPVVLYSRLAKAAPHRGLVVTNKPGRYQIHAWDVPTGELRQVTSDPTGKIFGYVQPDGRYIYYLVDRQGNELGHYVRVPFEGGEEQDLTPGLPAYSSFEIAVSRAGNLIGLSVAEGEDRGMQLYAIEPAENGEVGEPRLVHTSPFIYSGPAISNRGEALVVSVPPEGDPQHFRLLALDRTGRELGELWDGPGSSIEPRLFSPLGDLRLLAMSNASGVNRPLVWDVSTGERVDLGIGELEGEVQPADWSEDGRHILLVHNSKAVQQLYLYDMQERALTRLEHPSGTYAFFYPPYFAPGGEIYADWEDSTHPSRVVALDARTGAYRRDVLNAGEVPPGHAWRSVSFTSSDGQEIQGWLGLPGGEGPFPTILNTHGGPTSVANDLFSASSQMWLDHGFAFLTINYRGSTTFGREFEEQIRGDLGHWEVEDMVAARDWLVEQGIAQPNRIVPQGGSYGGYLTLMALGKYPELWAGGLALVPVVDWKMNHEDSAGTLQAYDELLLGGKPEEVPERYTAGSPLTYVDNVSAPVLIIAGHNDTRCPARPIEVYAERMRALGKPVELEWFDAGHGSLVIEQQIEQARSMLRFVYKLLD